MNREYIYKAKCVNWRKLPKEQWWAEGNLLILGEDYYIVPASCFSRVEKISNYHCGRDITLRALEVEKETVCRYTGLTDKNGRKVFEGDIIEVCTFGFNPERFITDVIYEKCAFRLKNGRNMFYHGQSDFTRMDDAKVAGNVFDNPELLKGGGVE